MIHDHFDLPSRERPIAPGSRGLLANTIRGAFAGAALALALAGCSSAPVASSTAARFTIPELKLAMIRVEAGTFTLGRPPGSGGESDESPETRVTFTKPFWLGATLVTVAQWRQFADATGYRTQPEKTGEGMWAWIGQPGKSYEQQPGTSWRNPGRDEKQDEKNPVVGIGWDDTQQFCAWLTKRERAAGRLPQGYAYSLPTEAQWEDACKAGTGAVDLANPDAFAWHAGNSGGKTHPVATKQANAWGFYDMVGNVWEWCQDWYAPYPGGSVNDWVGVAPTNGKMVIHNIMGNSFSGSGVHGTSPTNQWGDLANHDYRATLGFRIALVSVTAPPAVTP